MRWRAATVLVAVLAAIVPIPRSLIDRAYSSALFPFVQSYITAASNLVPVACFDLFIVVVVAAVAWTVIRDRRAPATRAWRIVAGRLVLRLATILSAAYLAFLILWGLNYRRVPLTDALRFDAARVTNDAAERLARQVVARLNELYNAAHRDGWSDPHEIDPVLVSAFARARQDLGLASRTRVARPKSTIFDPYFRRAGVAGMTDPYFLETLVATDLLPFERPFVVAHEWSHLAGLADEGAANFAGWLACLHGAAPQQYSGWLSLYSDVFASLPRRRAQEIAADLAPGPRTDLAAIRDRLARNVSPDVAAAGWKVYDRYLKANQVAEGARSYAEVVTLILGTEFTSDGVPLRR